MINLYTSWPPIDGDGEPVVPAERAGAVMEAVDAALRLNERAHKDGDDQVVFFAEDRAMAVLWVISPNTDDDGSPGFPSIKREDIDWRP